MICKKCNTVMPDNILFCTNCGEKLETEAVAKDVSSEIKHIKETKDYSAIIVFVILIICAVILIMCVARIVGRIEKDMKEANERLPEDQVVSVTPEPEDVSVAPEPEVTAPVLEETSYQTKYDTGWERTITYTHDGDMIQSYSDYWFAPDISGWSQSDIDYQADIFRGWVSEIDELECFELRLEVENDLYKCWFIITDMDNDKLVSEAQRAGFFYLSFNGEYCSMEIAENDLLNSGYIKLTSDS